MSKEKRSFQNLFLKRASLKACSVVYWYSGLIRRLPEENALRHAGPRIGTHVLPAIRIDHIAVAGIKAVNIADERSRFNA